MAGEGKGCGEEGVQPTRGEVRFRDHFFLRQSSYQAINERRNELTRKEIGILSCMLA